MATATITGFGIQTGTDRTVYAIWSWDEPNTKNYNVRWYYDTGNTNSSGTIWFIGEDSFVDAPQSTYSAPSNAIRVKFVVQPVSDTYKDSNGNDVTYWTAEWSTERIYNFSSNIPTTPSAPSVKIEQYTLTATLDNVDTDATIVQFQVLKDNSTVFKVGQVTIEGDYKYAQYVCYVDAGSEYKVRCRGYRNDLYGEWSEYSEKVMTVPATPSGFKECRAKTSTSVYLEWDAVKTAKSYEVEYTTKRDYFDSSDKTSTITGIETTRYEKTGLENGDTYFFRLRAVNDSGNSSWSEISLIAIGKKPAAPTTWSSTTTAIVGEAVVLYWVHNSKDGSSQTYAELEIYENDKPKTITIQNSTDEDLKDKISSYQLRTADYSAGTTLKWRVRTAGVTNDYGDWSIQRSVDIYAPATLSLSVKDVNNNSFDVLSSFPIRIKAVAGPATQKVVGYQLSVIATAAYQTVDNLGNIKYVNKGESLYSKYFDISSELSVDLSASDLSLVNNAAYRITCTVSMNSGLVAEESFDFLVGWSDEVYRVNCRIGIDTDSYVASICPYCKGSDGELNDDVTLSVYRREFNGRFTEILSGIANAQNTFVTDPHPALDYARYRIVATSKTNGKVIYYDVPAYPVGGKEIVIQWDEAWSNFDATITDTRVIPSWSGSMLKLRYNIDISDTNEKDVVLVEYIGREHPVSYHGTQLGTSSQWKTDIPADDKETLYALRRLQIWMGNVYVREPSGSGYWAIVGVEFNKNHCETTIPVSIKVIRVEGGI